MSTQHGAALFVLGARTYPKGRSVRFNRCLSERTAQKEYAMENEKGLEEKEFPLPIHGMSDLKGEGTQAPQSEEEKAQAEAEKVKQEEEATAERTKQFLASKYTVPVAGEDRRVSGEFLLSHYQKTAGLEVTYDKKVQEIARANDEMRGQLNQITSTMAQPNAPTKEEEIDPDSPEHLIDTRVKAIVAPIEERMSTVLNAVKGLAEGLRPQIGESNKVKAKELLEINNIDSTHFDTYHDSMVSVMEKKVGRTITTSEMAAISPAHWVSAFNMAKNQRDAKPSNPTKANGEAKPKEEVKTPLEQKKENKEKTIATGPSTPTNASALPVGDPLRKAVETKNWEGFDFHAEIMKRNQKQTPT